ncbi:uncharacterized protein [Montipora foliosa]|uniref:uncharacterized protein n=1 Tax=Montipora foliosa TaxID=591990 RepID=UPI0035F1FB34
MRSLMHSALLSWCFLTVWGTPQKEYKEEPDLDSYSDLPESSGSFLSGQIVETRFYTGEDSVASGEKVEAEDDEAELPVIENQAVKNYEISKNHEKHFAQEDSDTSGSGDKSEY